MEKLYLAVREKEGRLYPDEVVKELPSFTNLLDPLYKEWQIRANSAKKFAHYLKQGSKRLTILDIGCGNGWFASHLTKQLDCRVCALDINEQELRQGARVFGGNSAVTFLYGDIFEDILPTSCSDIILLASSIQYFSDLPVLLNRLLELLCEGGEIHIIDSPLYSRDRLNPAQKRTQKYYESLGFPEMAAHYYHHAIESLQPYQVEYLYKPGGLIQRIRGKLFASYRSPFPWIKLALNLC